MKQYLILFNLALIAVFPDRTLADEGMWMINSLEGIPFTEMQKLGLRMNLQEIYSESKPSVKDAIVMFGGGCTGEIISPEGLILTNHHCGEEYIQYHSTVDNDLLTKGFWAGSHQEELPVPGLSVHFLRSVSNVTKLVLSGVTDLMTEEERRDQIAAAMIAIEDTVADTTDLVARVEQMFGGNGFYLFLYEQYTDIRLVGAPPASIGNFGDETDNWMWPRHTADFSLFRVYGDTAGNPASYSINNIPYRPVYYLKIAADGVREGDFAMIPGYPGSTDRFATSFEVDELLRITHPNRIKVRGLRQDILKRDMDTNAKIRIQYTSKYSRSANYYKFSIGQARGLKRLNTRADKLAQEARFTQWVNTDTSRFDKYGEALQLISDAIAEREPYINARQMLDEALIRGIELFDQARKAYGIYLALLNHAGTDSTLQAEIQAFKENTEDFYKNYSFVTDRKVAEAMIKLYFEEVPSVYFPDFYKEILSKYKGDYGRYVQDVYSQSLFVSENEMNDFLEKPRLKVLQNDPAFQAAMSLIHKRKILSTEVQQAQLKFDRGHRLYVEGLMQMYPEKAWYPDANFTMRLTYGKVASYSPSDAVHYSYQTTLRGVMEKEDSANREFFVPGKLKTLYQMKDFGPYAEKGVLPVCFLTDNDITGGNSGSPVLNARGEVIGLAFDGNWEAMTGDIVFDPPIQRTICVDIRYFLFLLDKFAGAQNLLKELSVLR